MKASAVILAAGESRRMGRAKAYLPFRHGTFLSSIAATLEQYCSPVVAVFGFDAQKMMAEAPPSVRPVANLHYQRGMLTSLQTGLHALPKNCDTVIFTLVDHPAIAPATVELLLTVAGPIVIPRYGGRRGHPVLIRSAVIAEFLAEPDGSMIRDVIDRHAQTIVYKDVSDPGICDDIDNPELYGQLMAREAGPP